MPLRLKAHRNPSMDIVRLDQSLSLLEEPDSNGIQQNHRHLKTFKKARISQSPTSQTVDLR